MGDSQYSLLASGNVQEGSEKEARTPMHYDCQIGTHGTRSGTDREFFNSEQE